MKILTPEEIKIVFATPETVIHAEPSYVPEDPTETDELLGGLGDEWEILNPSTHWVNVIIHEPQANGHGNTFMCSSFGTCNCLEFVHKLRYGVEINLSDIFVGNGSGTKRGQGNTMKAPADFVNNNGFLYEDELPYTPKTTLDEVFAPMAQKLYDTAKLRLNDYETRYKRLVDSHPRTIIEGLKYSPVRVAVSGNYVFNSKGFIERRGMPSTHVVIIFDYEEGKCWWIFDSENNQYMKFDWEYFFESPMIHSIKKKVMKNLYRKNGQAAIGLYVPDLNGLVLYRDGFVNGNFPVAGGSLFKAMNWTYDMAQKVDEWPYPVIGLFGVDPLTGSVTFDKEILILNQ